MAACHRCVQLFFGLLAVTAAMWVRFSGGALQVTTLDLLIILVAAALPTIPSPLFTELGGVALESIILFYAIEIIMIERRRCWGFLRLGVLSSLAILAVRGMWA
jgi:hypothetical protein